MFSRETWLLAIIAWVAITAGLYVWLYSLSQAG